jgi:quercetin dioxygenase-like cupin family protein
VVAPSEPDPSSYKSMLSKTLADHTWMPLDPAAGDKSPLVTPAWGNNMFDASGFFLKLRAGSSISLHTHTSDYHGVVIAGSVTNPQDGQRNGVALPPQSYWYQPGGVAHTTACNKGHDCIAFVHFTGTRDLAPAKPAKGATIDPRYVELRAKDLAWEPLDANKGWQRARLWGDPTSGPSGMLIKIPAGSETFWHFHKSDYHAVVLAGTVDNHHSGTDATELPVGTWWYQPAGYKHTTSCKADGADCIVYAHFVGAYDVRVAD